MIAWGYYGILGRVLVPALERTVDSETRGRAVDGIERRALPFVLLSAVLFTVTGTYLLFIDPEYQVLGNFFASGWTTLMLVKHVLIIAFVAMGVVIHRLARRLPYVTDDPARAAILHRVGLSSEAATFLGAGIALLTTMAQVSA